MTRVCQNIEHIFDGIELTGIEGLEYFDITRKAPKERYIIWTGICHKCQCPVMLEAPFGNPNSTDKDVIQEVIRTIERGNSILSIVKRPHYTHNEAIKIVYQHLKKEEDKRAFIEAIAKELGVSVCSIPSHA